MTQCTNTLPSIQAQHSKAEHSPNAVVMIRPHHFTPNPQTAADNAFQQSPKLDANTVKENAYWEVTLAADTLRKHGVTVHLFEDEGHDTPDSVFPNNWFSTHATGQIGLYPMYCENRRKERNPNIIAFLTSHYRVSKTVDYSHYEHKNIVLEGTGSMVLDNQNKIAYAVKSKRMNETLFAQFCQDFHYQPLAFDASDEKGVPIYHTNVLMCLGTRFALIGLSLIDDVVTRNKVRNAIEETGKELIELSHEQIQHFAGNALELQTHKGRILAISQTAFNALTHPQISAITKHVKIVPLDVTTLEMAGGSIRCMLAGIHLEKKSTSKDKSA